MTYDRSNDPAYRAVKLSEVFDAIEKNGLPQIKNWFYEFKGFGKSDSLKRLNDTIIGTCALGQAAVNLNADANQLYDQINEVEPFLRIGDIIAGWNDTTGLTYKEIADRGRKEFTDHLNREVYIRI